MASNDKTLANEKCSVEDQEKEIKWKSLKMLMKNQKNRVKWSQKTCSIEPETSTRNQKQNYSKKSKKARGSGESAVTPTKRLTKKRKTTECYLPTSASSVSRNPFSEGINLVLALVFFLLLINLVISENRTT